MPVDQMERVILSLEWASLFNDALERPQRSIRRKDEDRLSLSGIGVGIAAGSEGFGLKLATGVISGQRIQAFFERATLGATSVEHFDQLPIPYRAVATDLNTGLAVVLDRGSLATAMRASMSLPAVFDPVEIDGQILVDGGLSNQLPIDVVREMGAEVVIAVNVGMPLEILDSNANLLTVINQLTSLMTVGNTRDAIATLDEQDLLITPELGTEVGSAQFDKGETAIQVGLVAGNAAAEQLARLASNRPKRMELLRLDRAPVIEFVDLDNRTPYANEVILQRVDLPIGKPLDAIRLEDQLRDVYALGTFAQVTYKVVNQGGRNGVVIRALPKPHGPNYVQIGLELNSDFSSAFGANFRTSVLMAPISEYGAEARLFAQIGSEPALGGEYYRPVDPLHRNAFVFRSFHESADVQIYDEAGNNTATFDVRQITASAAWVREFGTLGALNIGFRRGAGETNVATGDPSLPEVRYDIAELSATLTLDRLDNLYFPREGYYARLGMLASRRFLGADSNFIQTDLDLLGARRYGKHALQYGLRLHSTTSGTAPIQSVYRLGGRGRGIGYRRNELSGQHYMVLIGGYLYELADIFGRGAFIGGSLELTNAWESRSDIGLEDSVLNVGIYLGFDSWVGPMQLGYGAREGNEGTLFLEIGRQF
jgi:NTE family protein